MQRFWGILSGAALIASLAAPAAAQSFGGLAEKARDVDSREAMDALLWSQQSGCNQKDPVAKRQCELIREARRAQLASATFMVRGDQAAVEAGAYDAKAKRLPVSFSGCIACASKLPNGYNVVAGAGAVQASPTGFEVEPQVTVKVPFKSQAAADAWKKDVLPRLRSELIVKVASPEQKSTKAGAWFRLELVGHRVYDPCDGKIYAARPKSSSVAPDKRYCTGEPVEEESPAVETKPEKVEPKLPASLDTNMIRTALEPARKAARKCHEAYGVNGTARFRITISASGDVIGLRQKGDFVDTPTGNCIERAVKVTKFPETRRNKTTIDYPFILR
jgi:hypothetical protein